MGKTVREWRMSKGVSRMKLAEALGIHYNTVVNKEEGKSDWTLKEVKAIAKMFKISVADIKA